MNNKEINTEVLTQMEELEERIAPSGLGDPGNNNLRPITRTNRATKGLADASPLGTEPRD